MIVKKAVDLGHGVGVRLVQHHAGRRRVTVNGAGNYASLTLEQAYKLYEALRELDSEGLLYE